ncbi:MAG TPA: hypothetical protein VMV59_06500 [Candidatus Dormibacteraeota bacterium]|nr:hypothetical protein [Candidatus Dormibacteraeota bacterium]
MPSVTARRKRVKRISVSPHCRCCGLAVEPLPANLVETENVIAEHIKRSHPAEHRGFGFESDFILGQSMGFDYGCTFHNIAPKARR